MDSFQRSRGSVTLFHAHLVFVVKYRRRVLTSRVQTTIRFSLLDSCERGGRDPRGIKRGVGSLSSAHTLPAQRFHIASRSSLKNKQFTGGSEATRTRVVSSKLWGDAFWSPSFFASSAGGAPLEAIRQSFENQ